MAVEDDPDHLEQPNFDGIVGRMYADSKQLVPLTVRIPKELVFELKRRAIRSTNQLLAEHAYLLYLGQRLPKRLIAPFLWPNPYADQPDPAYLKSPLRSLTVRMPRGLLRWARVFEAEEEISDQELALRVFDSYVRGDRYPPNKEDLKRDRYGFLVVAERLGGRPFYEATDEVVKSAFKVLADEALKVHRKSQGIPDPEAEGRTEIDFDLPDDEWERQVGALLGLSRIGSRRTTRASPLSASESARAIGNSKRLGSRPDLTSKNGKHRRRRPGGPRSQGSSDRARSRSSLKGVRPSSDK